MRWKRSGGRYGRTPEPETPYQRAGQVWDERIGSAREQAKNWRLMALGGLFLSSGLAAALAWQSLSSRVVPYVVAVDRLGEARAVTPAERDYRPTDPQIAWHLAQFVKDVRGVSLDPVLMRENWLRAYDFARGRASIAIGDYARASDPFGHSGDITVSVEVTNVVRASDTSFQLKWIERRYERGSLMGTSRWTGILAVKTHPPANADALRKNPLGLYVEAIDWSRDLDTGPQPSAPPAPALPEPPKETNP